MKRAEKKSVGVHGIRSSAVCRLVSCILLGALLISGLSGCKEVSEWVNETIVITKSLKKNELFKIGDQVMTVEEARIFLTAQKSGISARYGAEFWNSRAGEKAVGDYMKEDLQANLANLLCLNQMAADRELTLNKTEEERISQAAETYYYALTEDDKQYMQVSLDQVKLAYRHYYMVTKLVEDVTQEADLEISDDEGRVITIQQIFVQDAGTAEEILNRAQNGTDFSVLAASYQASAEFERRVGREDVSASFAEAAFALSSGEISGVVAADDGFYVIKCLNHFEVEATLAHKEEMAAVRRQEAFQAIFEEYKKELKSYYNDAAWEGISFSDDFIPSSRGFFEVYQDFFG
ncbi:MAG: hypothetical protein HFI93_01370 [Lachnospiraceae bacterium]|nr:hypothetical protein [Lachnospiraceae bacterium]